METFPMMKVEEAFLLPGQFYERTQVSHARTGEQLLIKAVMEEAFHCLRLPGLGRRQQRLAQEAWAWFASESEAPFSFCWCCQHLGWDEYSTRQKAYHFYTHKED